MLSNPLRVVNPDSPMKTYVSMLRAINVSGHNRVKMEELKRIYLSLGYRNVKTYLQSGNVVFEGAEKSGDSLAMEIEKSLKQRLGLDVPVLIRTGDELVLLIKHNPFAGRDEERLHVTFLSSKHGVFPLDRINKAVGNGEAFSVTEREVYLFCPNGYGKTKLTNTFFEWVLKTTATTRNWRTTKSLISLAESPPEE
jgi:uncharacterized protein (DUF1697 family)